MKFTPFVVIVVFIMGCANQLGYKGEGPSRAECKTFLHDGYTANACAVVRSEDASRANHIQNTTHSPEEGKEQVSLSQTFEKFNEQILKNNKQYRDANKKNKEDPGKLSDANSPNKNHGKGKLFDLGVNYRDITLRALAKKLLRSEGLDDIDPRYENCLMKFRDGVYRIARGKYVDITEGDFTHRVKADLESENPECVGASKNYSDGRQELKELSQRLAEMSRSIAARSSEKPIKRNIAKIGSNRKGLINEKNMTGDTEPRLKSFEVLVSQFIEKLRSANYAYNVPSPISAGEWRVIKFSLSANNSTLEVISSINELGEGEVSGVVAGRAKFSMVMEAHLSGKDFEIAQNDEARKLLDPEGISVWTWSVKPLHPGGSLPLVLSLKAILPDEKIPAHDVLVLVRKIEARSSFWWIIDTYFEKYWKWIFSGLGAIALYFFRRRFGGKENAGLA